jgi:hypothetical protein
MAKRKRIKGQTMIYKTLHRKLAREFNFRGLMSMARWSGSISFWLFTVSYHRIIQHGDTCGAGYSLFSGAHEFIPGFKRGFDISYLGIGAVTNNGFIVRGCIKFVSRRQDIYSGQDSGIQQTSQSSKGALKRINFILIIYCFISSDYSTRWHMWSRIQLIFRSTWVHPRF